MEKKTKELINGTFIYLIGNGLVTVLQFVILKVITKKISAEDYGYYGLIISISSVLIPILSLQISDAVFRYCIKGDENEKKTLYSTGIVIILLGFLLGLIGSIIYSSLIGTIKCYFLIVCYFFVNMFFLLYQKMARVYGKNKLYVAVNIIKTILYFIVQIITIKVFDLGIESIFLAMVISIAFCNFILDVKLRCYKLFTIKCVRISDAMKLIRFSLPLVPNTIFYCFSSSVNAFIITKELDMSSNGIFTISLKFSTIISMIANMFLLAWQESAIKYYGENNYESFFRKTFYILLRVLLVLEIFTIQFCYILIPYMIDVSYIDAMNYVPLLVANAGLSALYGFFGSVY